MGKNLFLLLLNTYEIIDAFGGCNASRHCNRS